MTSSQSRKASLAAAGRTGERVTDSNAAIATGRPSTQSERRNPQPAPRARGQGALDRLGARQRPPQQLPERPCTVGLRTTRGLPCPSRDVVSFMPWHAS